MGLLEEVEKRRALDLVEQRFVGGMKESSGARGWMGSRRDLGGDRVQVGEREDGQSCGDSSDAVG
jgi:hypothetical protein